MQTGAMMDKLDLQLIMEATERLEKLRPGLVCPFCNNENSFIHQQRMPPTSYAINVYNRESTEVDSAYRLDLITCKVCGYNMTFHPEMLSHFLNSLEHQNSESDADKDDKDASRP